MISEPTALPLWEHLDEVQRDRLLLARDESVTPCCYACAGRTPLSESTAYRLLVADGALFPGDFVLVCRKCQLEAYPE